MRAKVIAMLAATAIARAAGPAEAQGEPSAGGTVEIAPQPSRLQPRLRFQRLDRQQGLPQNSVSSVVQDRTGFMWLGTEDGLARYDGQRFLTFRHDPSRETSLSASFITALLVGKDGTLWVGTQGGGLNRYRAERGQFERLDAAGEPGPLNASSVSSMAEGPDGRIWIASLDAGLTALDPKTLKATTWSIEDGLTPTVSAVAVGKDSVVWVGTASGLYRMVPGRKGFEILFQDDPSLKAATVTALAIDAGGQVWLGTEGAGLARFAPSTGTLTRFRADAARATSLADDAVKSIMQDQGGALWVGTELALHVMREPGRFERHAPDVGDAMSLPAQASDIFQDAAGVIWVGTFGGGAALLDPRSARFRFYKTPPVTTLNVRGDDLWVSTFRDVCRWRGTVELEGICYPTGWSTNVLVDRKGTVWVGTWSNGLLRLDPGSTDRWTAYRHDPGDETTLAGGPVLDLYEDRAGHLWVSFLGGGLQRFDDRRRQLITVAVPTDTVYGLMEDPAQPGVLWMGTGDAGLLRLDGETGEVKAFTPIPNDRRRRTDNAVVDFVFAGKGIMWVATYGGGLKRLDTATGTFTSFRRADGIPSDTLCALLPDAGGRLWVSTIAGLARWDPASRRGQLFGTADGLQSIEFAQHSRTVTPDGRMLFGGVNGFNVFRPGDIEVDRYKPPLVLTSVRVLDEPYRGGLAADTIRRLELAHDEVLVNIEFAALSFSGSDETTFEYQIEGLDDHWVHSDSASVSLAGLDAGDYRLHVRAKNRHGTESPPIALDIAVAPPLYLSWWAFAIYGLVLAGIGFWLFRSYRARITRLKHMARLAHVEREFEVTATVQSWFLPRPGLHRAGGLDIVGFYRGAEKCSGDWWWYEDIGDDRLWLVVADVTGHGAGPAMLTAAVAMGLWVQSGSSHESVVERLTRVNRVVLERCKGKAIMSMTAVVLDQKSGEVTVYGLGGLPALVLTPEGKYSVLTARGSPLGSSPTLDAGITTARLSPSDRLLITTDGMIETEMAQGTQQLGFRRFVRMVHGVQSVPLDLAVDTIVREVDQVRGSAPQTDDFTFCLVERRA